MTRYKKYLKSKGVMLDNDFPFLPINRNDIYLFDVFTEVVDSGIDVFEEYDAGTKILHFDRNGTITYDFD